MSMMTENDNVPYSSHNYARVAELVDALASGASVRKDVEVQVLSRVPKQMVDDFVGLLF